MHTPAPASPGLRVSARTYPGEPEHVRQVRADMRRLLDGCPVADDVILCVSELATNSARHSDSRKPGGTFTVRAESRPGAGVRIEVEDAGGPWVGPAPDPTGGRGLDIVRALAAEWGIVTRPASRAVWARIDWPSDQRRDPDPARAMAGGTGAHAALAELAGRRAS
jgi:anti-sigma regulatory factor (Ser/Thr protein kinase)